MNLFHWLLLVAWFSTVDVYGDGDGDAVGKCVLAST